MVVTDREVSSEHAYSLPHYRYLLRKARELGYELPKVRDVAFDPPGGRWFLIRHDVDLTPWAALEMAELEAEEGVRTTYYFRLHAETYNLAEPGAYRAMLKIADLGHEIGLHYEPGFHMDLGRDPLEGVRRDLARFEELLGRRTETIAQHQPATGPVLAEISEDHADAYDARLVRDIPYFGDSGFHWREGCVCTKLGLHERLHTLIHPHSWTIWDRGWREVLRAHAADLGGRIASWMEDYILHLEDYLQNRPRLDREREARYREDAGD